MQLQRGARCPSSTLGKIRARLHVNVENHADANLQMPNTSSLLQQPAAAMHARRVDAAGASPPARPPTESEKPAAGLCCNGDDCDRVTERRKRGDRLQVPPERAQRQSFVVAGAEDS